MSFGNFLRRISFDSEKIHTDSPTPEGSESPGMNSFFASPSRIFESVNAKTGHLVSDLNQKLDISGKLDSIKQVSVGKLEHVVRGSSVIRSDSKDVTRKDDTPESIPKTSCFDQDVTDSTINFTSQAPLNDKATMDLDKPQTGKSTSYAPNLLSHESQSVESHQLSSGSTLRRQSTQNTPRPPRPPPPSSAALSRAMSLDETNLSAQMKSSSSREKENQSLDEQLDDQKTKYSGKDRGHPLKSIDESRKLQKPNASVIEEDENSSASEYGENGDQPIYRQETDLTLTVSGKTSSTIKSFGTQSISSEDKTALTPPSSTLPNTSSKEKVQEFMDLYTSALIIGRSDYLKSKENELQELLITPIGRIAFVNALEQESRRTQGLVDLQALPKLLDQISLLLVECQNAEDFQPAKKLLTISLKFYTYDPSVSTDRTFIFVYIKSQPIWQSLRFWNACFFQSLQEARSKAEESSYDSTKVSSSTTYDQLKSYLHTMNVFNLHETIKQEFLRKQADLFNLNDDEISSLLSVISSVD